MIDISIAIAAACAGFAAGWICGTAVERCQSRWQRHPPYSSAAIALSATEGDSHRPGPYSSHPQGFPPPPPKVGCERWFIINSAMIAECGGPCTIDPSHCDCGALWVDFPTTNQPPEAP